MGADNFVIESPSGAHQKLDHVSFNLLTNLGDCFSDTTNLNFGYDGKNPNSFLDSLLKNEKVKIAVMTYDE